MLSAIVGVRVPLESRIDYEFDFELSDQIARFMGGSGCRLWIMGICFSFQGLGNDSEWRKLDF